MSNIFSNLFLSKSLIACIVALLASMMTSKNCSDGTSMMLNSSKLDFLLIRLFIEKFV